MSSPSVIVALGAVPQFVAAVVDELKNIGLDVAGFEIDHVCFRCETNEEYRAVCNTLTTTQCTEESRNGETQIASAGPAAEMLLECMIGGRPVATLRLSHVIQCGEWQVNHLEVASPKKGRSHIGGLEHLEVVITPGFGGDNAMEQVELQRFAELHPAIEFDHKAAKKNNNPDISITLSTGCSAKFHCKPLAEVCRTEMAHQSYEPVPSSYFENFTSAAAVLNQANAVEITSS